MFFISLSEPESATEREGVCQSESDWDMGAFQVKLHELLSIAQPLGI